MQINVAQALVNNPNVLINAGFRVNQRNYATGTATTAADEYTLDRWRVLILGESITFPALGLDNTITAPAGGMGQKVEDLNIDGGEYVISWEGTATCKIDGVARVSGESFAVSAGTQVDVVFYGGTVNRPKLERGTRKTEFLHISAVEDEQACLRYFERVRVYGNTSYMWAGDLSSGYMVGEVVYSVRKRATPTITTKYEALSNCSGLVAKFNVATGVKWDVKSDIAGGRLSISFWFYADAEL